MWLPFLLLVSIISYVKNECPPEVTTTLGRLRGKSFTVNGVKVDSFLSIPYAKPAFGELKFQKPEPAVPWTGTKNATSLPPACPQYSPTPYPWNYNKTENMDEDCLFLNIWTPSFPKVNRPIMVYIHGGGFYLGSSRDPLFNGSALAATGDVVVVTINYRLGAPGFLYSGTKDAPGNVGFYDMLLALKWVNENAKAFNGDKERITIFGQSAGSISVGYLCISNLTTGLFKRAILQSGSPFFFTDGKEANLDLGQSMAKFLNCADNEKTLRNNPKEVVSCLRGVSAANMANAIGTLQPHSTATLLGTFGDPIVGIDPIKALQQGKFKNVDILIGIVKDEGAYLVTTSNNTVFGYYGEKSVSLNKTFAESLMKTFYTSITVNKTITDYYLNKANTSDEIQKQLYTAAGDFILTCPAIYHAEEYSKRNNSVYFYSFEHRPSNSMWTPLMGIVHYDEVQFVFGKPVLKPQEYNPSEVALSYDMMKIWSDFAKTGKPDQGWPIYSREKPVMKRIDAYKKYYGESPYRSNCEFLRPYFESAW